MDYYCIIIWRITKIYVDCSCKYIKLVSSVKWFSYELMKTFFQFIAAPFQQNFLTCCYFSYKHHIITIHTHFSWMFRDFFFPTFMRKNHINARERKTDTFSWRNYKLFQTETPHFHSLLSQWINECILSHIIISFPMHFELDINHKYYGLLVRSCVDSKRSRFRSLFSYFAGMNSTFRI